jgi:hypothetical protein
MNASFNNKSDLNHLSLAIKLTNPTQCHMLKQKTATSVKSCGRQKKAV